MHLPLETMNSVGMIRIIKFWKKHILLDLNILKTLYIILNIYEG